MAPRDGSMSKCYYCQHIQSLRPSVFLVKVLDIKEAEREDDSLLCPSRDASPKGKLLLYFSNAKQRNLWMWKLLKPQWNIESFITTLEAPAHSLQLFNISSDQFTGYSNLCVWNILTALLVLVRNLKTQHTFYLFKIDLLCLETQISKLEPISNLIKPNLRFADHKQKSISDKKKPNSDLKQNHQYEQTQRMETDRRRR
ncbi:hypothetical protein YC2023_009429 [Brassica napus]